MAQDSVEQHILRSEQLLESDDTNHNFNTAIFYTSRSERLILFIVYVLISVYVSKTL
jgi:hypothetical protein